MEHFHDDSEIDILGYFVNHNKGGLTPRSLIAEQYFGMKNSNSCTHSKNVAHCSGPNQQSFNIGISYTNAVE